MATIAHTLTQTDSQDFNFKRLGTIIVTWAGLGNGDVGKWVDLSNFNDLTFQVRGTFGSGGQVDIEGSNNSGTTAAVLSDLDGNALNVVGAGIDVIREGPQMVRPNVSAGDGTTDLTIILVAKR